MVLGRIISYSYVLRFDDMKISSADKVTLLSVTTDNKLTLKNYIDELRREAPYTFHALRRIRSFLSKQKPRLLVNAFINFQFLYTSLISIFDSKISINKIQVVYHAHDKSYE